MEVWVAGATGVLGRHTVPQLLAAGHRVVGLARSPAKWPDAPPEMRFEACDITMSGQVIRAFATGKPDAVLHLATAIPSAAKPPASEWARNDAVRRAGTENLLEAALLADAYYVQQSVHNVYKPQGDGWIREEAPFERSNIMASAIDAERLTHSAFNRGLRGCVIRPAMFYSGDSSQIHGIAHALQTGLPVMIGQGQNYWSLVHPQDVGAAIVRILEALPLAETFNLADNDPAPMKEVLNVAAQHLHAHPPRSTPAFMAKLAVNGDVVDLLAGSRRISNEKARRELSWNLRYPTWREGLPGALDDARRAPKHY